MRAVALLLFAIFALSTHAADPKTAKLSRGFAYVHDEVPSGPWSIHVVKIDRGFTNLQLHTLTGRGEQIGLAPLSEQVKLVPKELGRPIAAINGDYYRDEGTYAGDPKGLLVTRGTLISAPCGWTCFWVDTNGAPQMTNIVSRFEIAWPNGEKTPFALNEERPKNGIALYTSSVGKSTGTKGGRELLLEHSGQGPWLPLQPSLGYSARVREVTSTGNTQIPADAMILSVGPQSSVNLDAVKPGALLHISTSMTPELPGVITALSGGPALVRNGSPLPRDEVKVRNPRSAIGWNDKYFYLVQVDGRQLNISEGMTNEELAAYLAKIGCDSAMSYDGGGSATIWVYGQVMNMPSEGFEREMANSLVVVRTGN